MKLKLTILILAGSFVCTFAQKKQPTKVELEASNIIRFGNTVIGLGNSYTETLKNYESVFTTADGNAKRLSQNSKLQPYFVRCDVSSVQARQQDEYGAALKAVQSFPEKEQIIKNVAEGGAAAKNVSKWCEAISNYFSRKEYAEDDQLSKYAAMKDSMEMYLSQTSNSWRKASMLASEAGSRAELILLQGSPIASFVIPMKKDLSQLDKILGMLNSKDRDINVLKEELKSLSESVDVNKDVTNKDIKKLRDIYYKEVFETYYRHLGYCISYTEKLVNKLESGADSDQLNNTYGYLSSEYNKIIEKYNLFIKQ